MSIIELKGLTRFYGSRRGIDRLTLSVPEGSLFGFLGSNGAGKTTTIRVLLGFLRPTSGQAHIFGLDCWKESKAIKRDIGYLPGDLRLPAWMTGLTALSIFGRVRNQNLLPAGRALAERFQLDLGVKVRDMSRGMRQKLGLLLALAHLPRLVLLDEPTASLDPLMQQTLHALLREMAAQGHTIFFSSHLLAEVEDLCDRVAIVRNGELVADETLASLRAHAGRQVVIRWASPEKARDFLPPPSLKLTRREDALWQADLEGPVQPLIDFLAGKPVADLQVTQPDLETLFRRFYSGEEKEGT